MKKKIGLESIDKNFKVERKVEREGLKFYDIEQEPFEIYGVYRDGEKFRRMPEEVAKSTKNDGVIALHANTAGGRVRFSTDSPYVAIRVKYGTILRDNSNFGLTGAAGFDIYVNEGEGDRYHHTFVPPYDLESGYESLRSEFGEVKMRDITINFPPYSEVEKLYIGIDENSKLEKYSVPYIDKKPIVYYGSSITQGGCASRAGNSYQGFISRRFNCDYINLGFSGSARAEDELAEYISELDMSIFVYDYEHNAPTIDYLKETHEKMFKTIRKKHPELPIIIMTSPRYIQPEGREVWCDVVKKTYENAVAAGDKNVYFLDGKDLMALCKNEGTVDKTHPNDLGFFSMASAIGDVIEKIWK